MGASGIVSLSFCHTVAIVLHFLWHSLYFLLECS